MGWLAAVHGVVFPVAHTLSLFVVGFVPWVVCKHVGAWLDSPRVWFLGEPAAFLGGYYGARYILSLTPLSRTFDFPEVVIYRAGVFAWATVVVLLVVTPVLLDRGLLGKPRVVRHPREWATEGFVRAPSRRGLPADD